MKIINNIFDLNKAIQNFKGFGFVPTMGGIHEGHISLIKKSKKSCKRTIVSVFVNPKQFNDKKDFKKYPRNLNKDINILKRLKINYLFVPSVNDVYRDKKKKFKLNSGDKILCAKYRKGHFEGVLNVMDRLLSLIKPKKVFMGEKDFQQLYLIKKYLSIKHSIKIINCKTIRDKNNIALSTRNNLLKNNEYKKVVAITNLLINFKKKNISKKKVSNEINEIINKIESIYKVKIDYLEYRNEKNLKLNNFKKKYRLFVAYSINKIRLIDNF